MPYRTADGDYWPTRGIESTDCYNYADLNENPSLSGMARAALTVLEHNEKGFWLMVEAGDVDWAMHNNNIDDTIGAIYSGEAAFRTICRWIEQRDCWDDTALIITADHGHLLILDNPEKLAELGAHDLPCAKALASESSLQATDHSK